MTPVLLRINWHKLLLDHGADPNLPESDRAEADNLEDLDFSGPIQIEATTNEDAYSKWRWEKDLSRMQDFQVGLYQEEEESLSLELLTPLAVALAMGHDAIIELLKARGATQ